MVRPAEDIDAAAIAEIYNYYVLNTTVTFEEEAVSAAEMQGRIAEVREKFAYLVYEENGKILGYAYGSPWKSRCAYRYSSEISIYLKDGIAGKGIGTKLYEALLAALSAKGLHSLIGGLALPNDACIALHKKFGFEKVAQFKEVGFKFGKWIDVAYYERIFR